MSKSEDYLDHLLKGVSGGGDDDLLDLSDDGSSGVMDVSDRENNSVDLLDPADDFTLQKEEQSISMGRSKSEDDFLKDFERELLDADDTDHFLEEFEKEMNRNETEPKPVAADKPMMDDIDGILNSAKSRMEEETPESNLGDMMVNTIDEPMDGGEFDQSLGDMLDGLGSLGMEGTSEMQEAEEESAGAAEAAEETTAEDTLSQFTDDSDLMALLNEESDFSGLMESETQEAGNETGDTAADLGQFSDEGLESLLKEDSFDEMVEEPEAEEVFFPAGAAFGEPCFLLAHFTRIILFSGWDAAAWNPSARMAGTSPFRRGSAPCFHEGTFSFSPPASHSGNHISSSPTLRGSKCFS